ncbi:hypothetical protein RFI_32974 [Reticulomyxa filosa]|uniref:Uncharacterized protein n=1 Tax=Reticulomyxa filosa TaxID=46433 RepID=X6LS29_RETFI|nr:hypothetical protein RFI_32974 [Reticulomyxa filosa]|eukprot:ETO04424.1 hypothetical protein RFI_32974 [Reticulomyxa filosa]
MCSSLVWHQLTKDDKGYTSVLALLQTTNDRIRKLLNSHHHQTSPTSANLTSATKSQSKENCMELYGENKDGTDIGAEPQSPSFSAMPETQYYSNSLTPTAVSLLGDKQTYPAELVTKCRFLHEYLTQVILHVLNRFLRNYGLSEDVSRRRTKSIIGNKDVSAQLTSSHSGTSVEKSSSGSVSAIANGTNNAASSMADSTGLRFVLSYYEGNNLLCLFASFIQHNSDISDTVKGRLGKNLYVTLNVAEWSLMNHPFSMLHIARTNITAETPITEINESMLFDEPFNESDYPADDVKIEIVCLKRLLRCTLQFLSFKQFRQLVLRRLLRFMKEIMPHPACEEIFDDCVDAIREFYLRLLLKRDANLKTMRIAYSFLKNAYQRFERRDDKERLKAIRQLQEEAYLIWGPQLFADMDPNSLNQMVRVICTYIYILYFLKNKNENKITVDLEKPQQHAHSLWIFFQHQHHWECIFQDDEMRRFRQEFERFSEETQKIQASTRSALKKFLTNCAQVFEEMKFNTKKKNTWCHIQQEEDAVQETIARRRNERRDLIRELKKFMDFFDDEFASRFPDEGMTDFWEIDPRESDNHTRLLLIRNLNGTYHPEAVYEAMSKSLSTKSEIEEPTNLMKRVSKHATHLEGNAPVNKQNESSSLLPEIVEENESIISTTQMSMISDSEEKGHEPQSTVVVNDDLDVENEDWEIAAHHTNSAALTSNTALNLGTVSTPDTGPAMQQQFQKANILGKILFEGTAVNISPFYKIEGIFRFVFEGQKYLENVFQQNVVDQIKLKELKLKRLAKHTQDEEILKMLEMETQEQREKLENSIEQMIEYDAWYLNYIKSILPRRYLLREVGIEMWIAGTHKSFFFAFENTKKRNEALTLICKYSQRLVTNSLRYVIPSPKKILKTSQLTQRWQKRLISNFDYLMELNVLAGRTYNDVTQYPVFPWVLINFHSSTMDLNDTSNYRDLSKPVGALNPERLEHFIEKYRDSAEDVSVPPYHYATHYMSAGICTQLISFALFLYLGQTLCLCGRFDIPDRLFHSLQNAWELSYTNLHDVKEVVPEMYYFPEMFRNINRLKLGTKQDGEVVDNVGLPLWANTPEEFVRISREALESEYVSQNLHNWIDLIFGYKQRGQAAADAYNVFNYLTYAGAVDFDTIVDPELRKNQQNVQKKTKKNRAATEQQIYHFGQTPNQLFDTPHMERLPKEECNISELVVPFKLPADYKPIEMGRFKMVEQLTSLNVVRNGQCLKCFDTLERLLSFEIPNIYNIDLQAATVTTTAKSLTLRTLVELPQEPPIYELMAPDWSDCILYQSFVISSNGVYGITAGYLDHSIKVHFLRTGEVLESVTGLENGHNDVITCLALASSQDILISGARDGSVVLWNINWYDSLILCGQRVQLLFIVLHMLFTKFVLFARNSKSVKPPRQPVLGKPYRLLSVHFDSVRALEINTKLGIIVSAADDQTIALYSIARKRFVRQIFFNGRDEKDHDDDNSPLREVVKIIVSDMGYIVVHTIEDTIPTLRVFSLNGILMCHLQLDEILFGIVLDQTGKILITGGQSCVISFRYIHKLSYLLKFSGFKKKKNIENDVILHFVLSFTNFFKYPWYTYSLQLIEEIVVLENQIKRKRITKLENIKDRALELTSTEADAEKMNIKNDGKNKKKVKFDDALSTPRALTAQKLNTLTPRQTHSSAWRAHRLSMLRNQQNFNDPELTKRVSMSMTLQKTRRSMLSQKRRPSRSTALTSGESTRGNTARRSTHFHGRFSSVDGGAILSGSHIIDIAIDSTNFFLIVACLDTSQEECKLLFYPLPNTKYEKNFDLYCKAVYSILENAQRTVWNLQKSLEESQPEKEYRHSFMNETLHNVKETSNKVIGNVKSFFKRTTNDTSKD